MFLSKIHISHFRGINKLTVDFDKKLNVIIGSNGQMKTALIDAIRLFYSIGDPNRDIEISKADFHVGFKDDGNGNNILLQEKRIDIVYRFSDLSDRQRGAFYQYLEKDETTGEMYARVQLSYDLKENDRVIYSWSVGKKDNGTKADWESLQYFCSYYLSALRDSTRDLLSTRNNLLGKVIKRKIDRASSEDIVKKIIEDANKELLKRQEVIDTKKGINDNLGQINEKLISDVSLHIEQSRIEYIVNVIKPYLPYPDGSDNGFMLSQNSLGYNNLIYIASVLSDIKDCHQDDKVSHYALLIEEPEAHLHPQLQINLYNFLKNADTNENSQTFITTHSPTLTSKIPLENLILLNGCKAIHVGDCFKERDSENIVRDTVTNKKLNDTETQRLKRMITRYFDVTRSQLLFSNGCLFIEGISECQLMDTFSRIINKPLTDNQIEIVDTGGTAFYQFLMLFNSNVSEKRIPLKAAFVTDEDQYTDSKNSKYNLEKLIEYDYEKLNELRNKINVDDKSKRVDNMEAMANGQPNIKIASGVKTLEYQICKANVADDKEWTKSSWLWELVEAENKDGIKIVEDYITSIADETLTDVQQQNVALLLWKCIPGKAEFAQVLNNHLLDKLEAKEEVKFNVPEYICDAIKHLVP